MIVGFTIKPFMLINGGLVLLALILAQILVGMRKIRFKGRTHMKVHKWGAWVLFGIAIVHGLLGMVYAFGWRIG